MIKSMTGYGRARQELHKRDITVEVRSVNNRYLDCTVKMPRMYAFAEDAVKKHVQQAVSRGKVDVFITVDATAADVVKVAVNRELAALYARKAREARYRGLFCVVSDPVDPLCRAVLTESNRAPGGGMDYQGLLTCQVRGFGLGVMNARAAYYARQDPRFASFLTDGRTFGPHGEDLVVANSIDRYDDGLSRLLTERTVHANLQMREMGFKPYVAPAISSGAMQLLLTLRRSWHCSSVALGGIWFGVRNRLTAAGLEIETASLPTPLFERLRETQTLLREII